MADLSTLGELELLPVDGCARIAQHVLELRDSWTARSSGGNFYTLGVNAYMDLAPATDAAASYDRLAQASNPLLVQHFRDLYEVVSTGLSGALDLPVRYAADLARPGFHVWTGSGIPTTACASIHFDLQYSRLLSRPAYAQATGTVSFTLPIRLPAAGSCLRVWPSVAYSADGHRMAGHQETEPRVVDYRVGRMLVHSGHLLHQIGPTRSVRPGDLRITLQGHGLVVDGELVLYW